MARWFDDDEIRGLDARLVALLDQMREDFGRPFVITSGARSPEHNTTVGGATDSAHLTGEAADGYFVGAPLLVMFVHALRYEYTGVGVYPWTTPPVIHLDVKGRVPSRPRRLWARDATDHYVYCPTPEFNAILRAL